MSGYYMPRLYAFLEELGRNNDRPWFAAHRAEYDELRALWLADVQRLVDDMALWEPAMKGREAREFVYRIYRDTRFSPDKTPYKTYFSAAPGPFGRSGEYAGYYLQLGPGGDSGIYGGCWCPSSPVLRKLRHAIVDNIEEFLEIVDNTELQREFPGWCSSMLKTIPKGWNRNHPQAFYLRMTNYGKFRELPADFFFSPDWPLRASALMKTLKPLVDFINYSIDE
jgi:uncharacterized protein (TIGR02453 family)